MASLVPISFLRTSFLQSPEDEDDDNDDDVDLAWIDDYPKRSSLPLVSPLPAHPKAVQRQLSVD